MLNSKDGQFPSLELSKILDICEIEYCMYQHDTDEESSEEEDEDDGDKDVDDLNDDNVYE